jgi:hypothetical protein
MAPDRDEFLVMAMPWRSFVTNRGKFDGARPRAERGGAFGPDRQRLVCAILRQVFFYRYANSQRRTVPMHRSLVPVRTTPSTASGAGPAERGTGTARSSRVCGPRLGRTTFPSGSCTGAGARQGPTPAPPGTPSPRTRQGAAAPSRRCRTRPGSGRRRCWGLGRIAWRPRKGPNSFFRSWSDRRFDRCFSKSACAGGAIRLSLVNATLAHSRPGFVGTFLGESHGFVCRVRLPRSIFFSCSS